VPAAQLPKQRPRVRLPDFRINQQESYTVHNLTSKEETGSASSPVPRSGALLEGADADILIARKVQGALIPHRPPLIDGLAVATLFCPSPAAGGDYFEIIPITEDKIVFLIFEACGNRLSASLISMLAGLKFEAHVRALRSPWTIIERVNTEIIRDISAGFYLTAFVGYLDLGESVLTYASAGHCSQLHYCKESGTLQPLESQGTIIGIFENGFFKEKTVRVKPGDWLLLFTDGMLDIVGGRTRRVAHDCLEKLLQEELHDATPDLLADRIRVRCERRGESAGLTDDVSLVAVEFLTQSRRNQIKEKLGFPADAPMRLQILNYFEEIDNVVGAVLKSMDAFGFADDVIRRMKVALIELLANAILHGNKRDFTKKVLMGHVVNSDRAVITIMDEGEGFVPDNVPDPTLPENIEKDCGRGIFLVRHFVDKMEHNAAGNRVTITKFHSADKDHAA
jgi:serine phosphatase RsbU (regulator of sigma subunit)/anti-sigma regulatory factor (Ser/Thr protein kinase)